MGLVKDEPAKYEVLACPFCGGYWEFQVVDSYDNVNLTFNCLKCKKHIVISKLKK